jgi:hypothetical protein
VIVAMLRSAPRRRRKSTADSSTSGERPARTHSPGTHKPPSRTHASTVPLGQAYGGFLELPVPVVLVLLWIFGALLLGVLAGVLVIVAFGTEASLLATIAALA